MRKYFLAGLLFWIPIWVTYAVIKFLVGLLDQSLALLPSDYQPDQLIGYHLPGLGLLFIFFMVLVTGLSVTNIIGRRAVALWERLLARIPLIRSVYSAVKQVLSAVIQPDSTSFKKVVMVEFPRAGTWAIGFQTSATLNNLPNGQASIAVFIPTAPNPTSGFLMIYPESKVTLLDMTVEEAFKVIVSVGVSIPYRNLTVENGD